MNQITIQLSQYTQDRLKEIAGRKGMSVSQLINEISLRYIGAEEGARMMQIRAARGSKAKGRQALQAVKKAGLDPLPHDRLDE